MKKDIVKFLILFIATSGIAHAQQINDTEIFKQNVNARFMRFIKNNRYAMDKFNRERAAQFAEFINRGRGNGAKLNDTLNIDKQYLNINAVKSQAPFNTAAIQLSTMNALRFKSERIKSR